MEYSIEEAAEWVDVVLYGGDTLKNLGLFTPLGGSKGYNELNNVLS